MDRLQEINYQESLRTLMSMINEEEIEGRKVVKLLKEINYRRGCYLAAQDKERDEEIVLWDSTESPIDKEK